MPVPWPAVVVAMLDKRYAQNTGRVTSRELEGETILLDLQADVYYYLNAVGSEAWKLLNGSLTGRDIAAALEQRFDAPLVTIEADLEQLLTDLLAMSLIEEK